MPSPDCPHTWALGECLECGAILSDPLTEPQRRRLRAYRDQLEPRPVVVPGPALHPPPLPATV